MTAPFGSSTKRDCNDCHRPGAWAWWDGFDPYYTHCSVVDFSVFFEKGFVLSLNFLKMLLPERARGLALRAATARLASGWPMPR